MHSQPDGPGGPSRRAFLIAGGTAVVAGAGAGVGMEFSRHEPRRRAATPAPSPPAELVDALAAERDLIAVLDASIPTEPQLRARLTRIRDDHTAHERALAAAVRQVSGPSAAPSAGPSASSGTPAGAAAGAAELARAERGAAQTAAARAARLAGRDAVLLASIAACEAAHAELLT
jgi:hypothetical protein